MLGQAEKETGGGLLGKEVGEKGSCYFSRVVGLW